ncbi:MAG TPA: hypothetical protein VGB89_13975 [Bacteroidota bacterium]|jgi:hypothetical protein
MFTPAHNVACNTVIAWAIFFSGCGLSKGAVEARSYLDTNSSRRTYLVSDSSSGTEDTISIQILGTTSDRGGRREQEVLTIYGGQRIFGRAITSGDRIEIVAGQSSLLTYSVRFPLEVGIQWEDCAIEAVDTIVTLEARERRAFRIQMTSLSPKDFSHKTYWIDPMVGLIRMIDVQVQPYSYARKVVRWELLSYNIEL